MKSLVVIPMGIYLCPLTYNHLVRPRRQDTLFLQLMQLAPQGRASGRRITTDMLRLTMRWLLMDWARWTGTWTVSTQPFGP